MYGRTFVLQNPALGDAQQEKVMPSGDPAQERGFQGPFTREDGFMGYNEVCHRHKFSSNFILIKKICLDLQRS
jgi:hypothetical protein